MPRHPGTLGEHADGTGRQGTRRLNIVLIIGIFGGLLLFLIAAAATSTAASSSRDLATTATPTGLGSAPALLRHGRPSSFLAYLPQTDAVSLSSNSNGGKRRDALTDLHNDLNIGQKKKEGSHKAGEADAGRRRLPLQSILVYIIKE